MTKSIVRMNCTRVKDTEGPNTAYFFIHNKITCIPVERTVTCARVIVCYQPQKANPNHVRITASENLIDYPNQLTMHTNNLTATKILGIVSSELQMQNQCELTSATCILPYPWTILNISACLLFWFLRNCCLYMIHTGKVKMFHLHVI